MEAATASVREKLLSAKDMKEKGNVEFKKGKLLIKHTAGKNSLAEACTYYAKALELVFEINNNTPLEDLSEEDKEMLRTLQSSLYLNLSIVGLLMDSPDTALNSANAAVDMDPSNPKALYRKAEALIALNRNAEALVCLESAHEQEPKNSSINTLLHKISTSEKLRIETEEGRVRREGEALKGKGSTHPKVSEVKDESAPPSQEPPLSAAPLPPAVTAALSSPPPLTTTLPGEAAGTTSTGISRANATSGDQSPSYTMATIFDVKRAVPVLSLFNGGEAPTYIWGQTVQDISWYIAIPHGVKAKHFIVGLHRYTVDVKLKPDALPKGIAIPGLNDNVVFSGRFPFPIRVDDCTWMIESSGVMSLQLKKEAREGGHWWHCICEGEDTIDIGKCSIGSDYSQLPDEKRREVAKKTMEYENMTPAEREDFNKRAEAQQAMEVEHVQNEKAYLEAMKDPKKVAMAELIKTQFPDIPIVFK